ncbi:alpha/beta hydrolase family protein [Stackebrandtia albiflava]|uniref:Alpha/beta hydrolase family protein n=1 Tax=Stackebrandtia albiflava TaxID=406432 RepID=A0A562V288_9ACTN|nr:alpha/beta hydrolase [Stackebrandtia albiflava]TWJ12006.1 alpha/beta hydrolase family protein [Stackebrandtia albiflava]
MVSFTDLKSAVPERIRDAATAFSGLSGNLDQQLDPLRTAGTGIRDAWTGPDEVGGTAAVSVLRDQHRRASIAQADLASISGELSTLADTVELAKSDLLQALEDAKGFALVAEDGSSIRLDMARLRADGVDPSDVKHYMTSLRGIADRIADAVRKATEADQTAKARIALLVPTLTGQPPDAADVPEPESDWTPQEVHDWWLGLTAAQRQSLLMHRPELIGPLDGVPTVYRDVANRSLLLDQIADVQSQLAADPDDKRLQGILEGLQEIQDRLDRDSGGAGYDDRAYLLLIDSSGDGQAVVAVGNPDEADNVVTMVPGTGTDLSNVTGNISRVDRMVSDANLRDPDSTAGILWFGYDAPDTIAHAALPGYAEDAETALRRFTEGMEAVQGGPDEVRNTMLGHSYGSTVVGHAAEGGDGVRTDQIILVASPGVGTPHASDLQIGAENVYATTAPNDLIHVVPDASWAHDTAPVMESFGAQVFESPPHEDGRIAAHSGYWDDGNPARDAFAMIVTGDGDDVPRVDYHERWYQKWPWEW